MNLGPKSAFFPLDKSKRITKTRKTKEEKNRVSINNPFHGKRGGVEIQKQTNSEPGCCRFHGLFFFRFFDFRVFVIRFFVNRQRVEQDITQNGTTTVNKFAYDLHGQVFETFYLGKREK